MDFLPESISRLIDELGRLPGIGPKSAQRLAFHLLKQADARNEALGEAITRAKEGVKHCEECHSFSSDRLCPVCQDGSRDRSTLCVVESTLDMIAIEKTREYKGLYHVLQGKLSPLDGIGPEQLTLASLFRRLTEEQSPVREVILALNPDLEGDTTALFLQRKLEPMTALRVSRIARGIPSGGHLEYTDDATLIRALQGRQMMN